MTFLKKLAFLLFLFFTHVSYSQSKISTYKIKVDKIISNNFEKSLLSKIHCEDVEINGLDSNTLYFGQYKGAKDNSYKISSATFYYTFYSRQLNYLFNFQVTIDKAKAVKVDFALFTEIPSCVLKNLNCGFISKDSAIKIALKDSIPFPKNVGANLYRNSENNSYYWFVYGNPKMKPRQTRTATKRSSPSQRRIINAVNGEIIPYEKYFKK